MSTEGPNTRLKRVLAVVGIILLLSMYVVLFYNAVTGSPATARVFVASAAATVAIPIVIYLILWVYSRVTGARTIASPPERKEPDDKPALSEEDTVDAPAVKKDDRIHG